MRPFLFTNTRNGKNPSTPTGRWPKKLTLFFFLSLGVWLFLFSLWVYTSFNPASHSPLALKDPGDKRLLQDSEDWMAIYFNKQKIGYSHTVKQRSSQGYTITQDLLLRLMVLGVPRQMQMTSSSRLSADFVLKDFTFKMVSGYLLFSLQGTVEGKTLTLISDLAGHPQTTTVTLKEPPQLPLTLPFQVYRAQMKPGDRISFSLFDPVLLSPQPVTITAGPTEILVLEEDTQPGQRFEILLQGNKMVVWIDYKGRILKEEGFMGFNLIRSTPEKARIMEKGSGPDVVTEMSIPIPSPPNPNTIRKLVLRLSPTPDSIPQTAGRQSFRDQRLIIEKESFSATDTYELPYGPKDREPFLADHPALTIKDPRLQKALKEALGQEKDAQKAARRLNTWVFQHLKKKPTLSLPRAVEILVQKEGDCNEHATLLLALLRAAGIPSRMALGLTLLRDRFYYHAWVEAYLGSRWISLDPTFNQFPADATHLKLAEGMEEGMVSLIPIIGKLKIQIESAL